jgi:phospho-N-acetylmuramoyl-pentapeptide-transferase
VITQSPVEEKIYGNYNTFSRIMNLIMQNCWLGREGYENGRGLFYSSCNFLLLQRFQMANLRDGIDGLMAGTSAISVLALVFTFLSGNIIF